MKVTLNTITSYLGQSLKLGDEIDLPLNIAQRWINKGIAHPIKEEIKPVEKPVIKPVIKVAIPTVKISKELSKVTEVDLIEPVPEKFTSFETLPTITEKNIDKLKISKPIWKPKKKK